MRARLGPGRLALLACAALTFAAPRARADDPVIEPVDPAEAAFAPIQARLDDKARPEGWREAVVKELKAFRASWAERPDGGQTRLYLGRACLLLAVHDEGGEAQPLLERARQHAKIFQAQFPTDLRGRTLALEVEARLKQEALARERAAQKEAARRALIGAPAPPLRDVEVIAGRFKFEDTRGQVVILIFVSTTAPGSAEVLTRAQALAAKPGVMALGVTRLFGFAVDPAGRGGTLRKDLEAAEERAVLGRWREARKLFTPLALAPKALDAYHVKDLPQVVIIDGDNIVREVVTGDVTAERLEEAVRGLRGDGR